MATVVKMILAAVLGKRMKLVLKNDGCGVLTKIHAYKSVGLADGSIHNTSPIITNFIPNDDSGTMILGRQ
jgi:hypothetical protein